jgi:phosphotransferase system HPr (HPr) family protein
MATAQKQVVIANKLGVHCRPAIQIVNLARQFKSAIRLRSPMVVTVAGAPLCDPAKFTEEADASSMFQLLCLSLAGGVPVQVCADGDDAEEAVNAIADLITSGFGEE